MEEKAMKKFAALLLTICMTALLTACGSADQGEAPTADSSAEGPAEEVVEEAEEEIRRLKHKPIQHLIFQKMEKKEKKKS